MKTIQEVLEWIDHVEQNAHLRPQFYVQVPIALEDLLLNINNLKYLIIDEEGLYERESFCKFLRTKGYGAYCFIQKNQLNQQQMSLMLDKLTRETLQQSSATSGRSI